MDQQVESRPPERRRLPRVEEDRMQEILKGEILAGIAQVQSDQKTPEEVADKLAARWATAIKNSIKDPLTGGHNRAFGIEELDQEVNSRERQSSPLSFLMIDIDHFKQVNDAFGHPVGDEVLKKLVRELKDLQKKYSGLIDSRWGGEELVLIAPGFSIPEMVVIAKELGDWAYANLANIDGIDRTKRERVTLSMGLASYHTGDTPEDLVERVDQLLYQAKGQKDKPEKRNRLVVEGLEEEIIFGH